jgi:hypothetical protein
MPLKIIENYDSSFTLEPETQEKLFNLLTGESFTSQIAQHLKCEQVEFTGLLFQPIPYSSETPKGMPVEFEQYHESEEYAIVNVPPNFMFTVKIFKPSRLCAVYKKKINQEKL